MLKIKSAKPDQKERAYLKIIHWFFAFPNDEFSFNDICSQVKISKSIGKEVIDYLKNEGFLEVNKIANLLRIRANIEHKYFLGKKIAYNLEKVYESGVVEHIKERIPGSIAIVLWGSFRKGDDIKESDLDIAVEVLGNEEIKILESGTIPKFGYRDNVKVNIYVFTRNKVDINVFTNIANGILLDGLLEVRP